MFVSVAVEETTYSFDKPFTYSVPNNLINKVREGMRVTVPFGTGNKTRVAMILEIVDDPKSSKIKEITSVLDKEPVLTKEMLTLIPWMKSRCFCTLFDCIRPMLPAGINYNVKLLYKFIAMPENLEDLTEIEKEVLTTIKNSSNMLDISDIAQIFGTEEKYIPIKKLLDLGCVEGVDSTSRKLGDATQKMIKPCDDFDQPLTPKQESVYKTLCEIGNVSVKELMYFTGSSISVINTLCKKKCAEIYTQEVYRKPKHLTTTFGNEKIQSLSLTAKQNDALDNIVQDLESGEKSVSLLYGVTGSGKTSIYLKLIDYVFGKGQDVILMVPEIALTPQTIDIFKAKFGDAVGVFHSGLTLAQRLDEWKRAKNGQCKIAIGTRSAVFAPFSNLGLIVIDEEQEHTYKSEMTPRYNAKDIAKFRIAYNKAFCLLASATPALESYYRAEAGVYGFNELQLRFGDAVLPEVRVVDMNQEELFGNKTDFSFALKKALHDTYRDGKQSIILLNRRGYHTYARCKSCKTVVSCPNCSISLTLHSENNRMMCHYCGHSEPIKTVCPECGQESISFSGYGTQRAEEALQTIIPEAKILRIDADSTSARFSLEKKLDAFANGEYDIMVGTQMVAKGLNFENVTLVGVLSADQSLYSDDFRSNERTFDLITQVVGRSGRGKYKGQAIIQTYIPENAYLRLAASQDYTTFYEMEKEYRRAMLYPPYVDIVVIAAVGVNEELVKNSLVDFSKEFTQIIAKYGNKMPVRMLRPSPAGVVRMQGKYRYKLIIKCKNTLEFRNIISDLLIKFAKNKNYSDVTLYADVNPYTIM